MFINNNFSFRLKYDTYEKYHPQIFLEECKYAEENIKLRTLLTS